MNFADIRRQMNRTHNVIRRNIQQDYRQAFRLHNLIRNNYLGGNETHNNTLNTDGLNHAIQTVKTSLNSLTTNIQRVNNNLSHMATNIRGRRVANNTPKHRTDQSYNGNRSNRMREAMHANGLTTNMVAELGASAYQHRFNHPTGTTAHAIQYGRQYINSGRNLLRNANASDTQTKQFNNAINRVKGASVSYRQLRRYGIRHQNLVDRYKGMISRGNTIASRYRRDYDSEIGKRSILANALKLKGIATSTDDDGHAFVTGNANDATTGLGQVNQMAKNGNQTAMSYMESNRAIDTYVDDFGTNLRNVNNALTTLKNNLNDLTSSNSNYGSFINNTTANKAQARFNPNATYVHYPSSTPTGMIQNMGGTTGLAVSGMMTATSAVRSYGSQGNSLRQQMEPGVNALTLGRAINGAPNVGHIDNHVADRLMQEGRWNGQTSQDMSQYLGALAGTRNTGVMNQTRTAGDVAQFARNNNVNPTDTSQLFSTLANSGGLGNQDDHGNVVDFTRQFAGMLHNDHLGAISNQQAQGLNSIFGNMIGSGQTLSPQTVRNITAMQGTLSSGPGGRVFQGQSGANQLNSLNHGVGSQFNNMMVRNAFAGASSQYGGQQGLYRLALDMQSPLKHPQHLMGMVQNLSSEVGPEGTKLALTHMGLSPDAASKFYRDTMNGKMNPQELHRMAHRDEQTGRSTNQHTNKQYRMQGNSTLDIKVAMGQQGRIHTSESFDSLRRGANRLKSLATPSGFMNDLGVEGGSILSTVGTASNVASLIGLFTGRNGSLSRNGIFHTKLNPLNWGKNGGFLANRLKNNKYHWVRGLANHISGMGSSNGTGGSINAQNNRFNNNYFYNNHFVGGSGGSNGPTSPSNTDNYSGSNSNGPSGNNSRDTDEDARRDKLNDLDKRKQSVAEEYGRHSPEYQRLDRAENDLRNSHDLSDSRLGQDILHNRGVGSIGRHGRGITSLFDLHRPTEGIPRHLASTPNAARNIMNTSRVARYDRGFSTLNDTTDLSQVADAFGMGELGRSALSRVGNTRLGARGLSMASRGLDSPLARVGLRHAGAIGATVSLLPSMNSYLNRPTWSGTKNLGSNALNTATAFAGLPGLIDQGVQLGSGFMARETGNKSWDAIGRLANVGNDVFHPIKNAEGIGRDLKSSANFVRKHPIQGALSSNIGTAPLEEAYRDRHHIANFIRHPLRSTGHGLHALGGMVGRGWRGLKSFAGRAAGGLRNTLLGQGGMIALARNYLYLREINRLLPHLASKLAGMFGVASITGKTGNSVNSSNVTNSVPQENAESVSKNNGNTTNTDNSTHDNHATNNYYIGGGRLGAASSILPSSLMNFFSHSHGDATS